MDRQRRHTAFTLIEVLVALAIVAVALTGLLRLQLASIKTMDRTCEIADAALWAQTLIDEALGSGSAIPAQGEERIGPRTYHWEQTVLPGPSGRLSQVVVRVKAEGPAVELSCLVARRGTP